MHVSLDKSIDFATGITLGLFSISGIMFNKKNSYCSSRSNCSSNINDCSISNTECPISPCSRTNLKLAIYSGLITSSLYIYRGLRH